MEGSAFLGKLVSFPLTDFQCHIGYFLIKQIADLARRQTLAGCQFLTVEALATKEYSAVGFYERCGFAPNELKKPYKDTLRMNMNLYSKE